MRLRKIVPVRALVAFLPAIVFGTVAVSGQGAPPPQPAAAPSAAAVTAAAPAVSAGTAAVLASAADAAFDSFNNAFYSVNGSRAQYKLTSVGGKAPFWRQAEMIEMVEDAYQRTGKALYKNMLAELYRGFFARYGHDWTGNRYNDDVMWMILASIRAYTITGNTSYLTQARVHFARIYARARTAEFGGGLWWTTARGSKNTCINAPAAIAAGELYAILHYRSYLNEARSLYAWMRKNLYNVSTGAVYDCIYWTSTDSGRVATVNRSTFSYNQGTFIGAANLLYRLTHDRAYYTDAMRTLDYTKDNLTTNGVLRSEGSGDGGGFRGIFARWAVKFTRDNKVTKYDSWFARNASTAWSHRNTRRLMSRDWTTSTPNATLYAFDCSSAVVLMQVTAPGRTDRDFVP